MDWYTGEVGHNDPSGDNPLIIGDVTIGDLMSYENVGSGYS